MSPATGQSLLHYSLVEKIGEGGMGVVWRARDTRLGRDVAIKLLPESVSGSAERLARLAREARTLASLQHPNVASIFGLEEAAGVRFLVMEMVPGEDLAQRLLRGPVPVKEALVIALQIAEGLESAHEKGIVHRDLKPANVKLAPDGRVKVLDFGLAKVFADEGGESAGLTSHSPTLTAAATRAGVLLGTAAYMSPEQARDGPVDRRADIWAFGCVLYEMLTAIRPFAGGTVSDTLAAVLKSEPDWSLLPEGTTPRLLALMRRCLRKDARERLRDIGDARLELAEEMSGAPDAVAVHPGKVLRNIGWVGTAAGLLAGILLAIAGLRLLAPAPPTPALRKVSIPIPQLGVEWFDSPRISPDGHHIAYTSRGRLWVRDLRRFEPMEVPESEGAGSPFWSPDSTRLGFARSEKIWTWALAGGASTSICPIPGTPEANGGAIGKDGKIYFAAYRGGLYEIAAAGGVPRLILPPTPEELDFHLPELLPDGKHLIMVAHRKEGPQPVIAVSTADGTRRDLSGFDSLGSVAYSPTGHLLLNFVSGRPKILAVPFSETRLEIAGEPFLVAPGGQFPTVSGTGHMVYSLGSSSVQRELVWVDREGRIGAVVGRPRLGLDDPAISPDGRKIAVVAWENENADIWIQDVARGTWIRLVSGPLDEEAPVWSPSGDRIFYAEKTAGLFLNLMEVPADGSGAPRRRAQGIEESAFAVSPDGRQAVFTKEQQGRNSLWRLDLEAGSEPVRFTPDLSGFEYAPAISPDGRWLAYTSSELGPVEVFIRRFPGGGEKQQVSLNGGSRPFWSRKGDALYYLEGGSLMEVPVRAGATPVIGAARRLFSPNDIGLETTLDIAADGRFLVVRRSSEDPRVGLLLVENWFEEFRKR